MIVIAFCTLKNLQGLDYDCQSFQCPAQPASVQFPGHILAALMQSSSACRGKTIQWAAWDSGLAGLTSGERKGGSLLQIKPVGLSSPLHLVLVKIPGLQITRNHLWLSQTEKGFIGKILGSSEFLGDWRIALRTGAGTQGVWVGWNYSQKNILSRLEPVVSTGHQVLS